MNTKGVLKAFDEAVQELMDLSTDEFKKLIEETPDEFATILREGGFFKTLDETLPLKDILENFPEIGES